MGSARFRHPVLAMSRRRSYKVQQLMKRLRECMLDTRATFEDRGRMAPYLPLSSYEHTLNDQARCDDTDKLSLVTTPQVRRAMMALIEDDHVVVYGEGKKRFRAITVYDKLRLREQQSNAATKEALLTRLRNLGIPARWGAPGTAIDDNHAMALAEMLEDFPGIAAQYFDLDNQQQD